MLLLTTTLCTLMRDTRYLAGAILMISMCYVSCGRQDPAPVGVANTGQRGPSTPAERALVSDIKDVSAVLESVYDDPEALKEVNAAIASGYYQDECVLLADLLYPDGSGLYRFMARRKNEAETPGEGVRWGAFAEKFREVAPRVLGKQRASGVIASAISIYHPYSSGFSARKRPLIVPATVEADWADVPDPHCERQHLHDGASCSKIRVDDAYAMEHPVHIVGAGADLALESSPRTDREAGSREPEALLPGEFQSERVRKSGFRKQLLALPEAEAEQPAVVFLGRVRCNRQYDRLISFTGNGGGSELKFIRGETYITLNNDQHVTKTEFDVISVYFRRKDIRKEREKDVYAIWDPDWEPGQIEQVFGIYEEDTRGELEFSGSIETEIEHPAGESTITPVEYSLRVPSQDEIIRQINWSRSSFFYNNQRNLAGCGLREGFTWYDCRLPVAYSLPAEGRGF